MGALGLVRYHTNKELDERARAQRAVADASAYEDSAPVGMLAAHIEKFWQAAYQAKIPIERQMLSNLRQRNGVYEPDELALIKQAGSSEIFMFLTAAKCRGFESWMRDVLLPDVGRPYGLDPMPMPDLPPPVQSAIIASVTQAALAAGWDVQDQRVDEYLTTLKYMAMKRMKDLARKIADRHELKIEDQFDKGGMELALSECIYDMATFPAAIMKGPTLRKRPEREWVPGANGYWLPKVTQALRCEYGRRSPLDIFPAPRSRGMQHGNLVDRYYFTRSDIESLRGVPRFADDALDQVLESYGTRGYRSRMFGDSERANLELRSHERYDPEQDIEALNFWGSVSGRMLMDWSFRYKQDLELIGMGEKIEPYREYQVEAWKIGRFMIMAQINPDPMGERPYDKASFEDIPGSFWGKGIPETMADCQRMCNAAARHISNNAAIASGPQVEVNVDRVAAGEQLSQAYPWKLWQTTTDMTGNNQPAIRFNQPAMEVQQLLMIYNHFSGEADNVTNIPKYSYGDAKVSGAGRTASGLNQLMGAAGKGMRRAVAAFDRGITRAKVTRQYDWNMEWDPDITIKFGLRAVARGAAQLLIQADTAMRQREMLQATANPIDAQIIGMPGRREMLRPALKNAGFDVEKILPDDLQLQIIEAKSPPMHMLAGAGAPNGPASPGGGGAGMDGGGGTPEGGQTTDGSGQPSQGTEIRRTTNGYRDGGMVRRQEMDNLDRGV